MDPVLEGITTALSLRCLLASLVGVWLGIIFGALPGLTAAMGVSLLIPLTFGMPAVEAFSALIGMYVGAVYGGCIPAVLLGTPGTVASAATALEGPSLTAQGKSLKALDMATVASFFGGIFSAVALIVFAPMLAKAAMRFGPTEYFAVAVFGLTIVASLTEGQALKGFIAVLIGLFIATIGLDPVTADLRNTFGNVNLFSGIALVPVLIGLFALSQILVTLEDLFRGKCLTKDLKISKEGITLKEIKDNGGNLLRSAVIGVGIGVVPGIGVSAATFVAYAEAKRYSKTPELYGKGAIEGIAAAETATNAQCGGALIPMMTLGIPGDLITGIMLGALVLQGLTPGPLLFVEHPATVYGIFAAYVICCIFLLVFGLITVRMAGKIVHIPNGLLMPIVLTLCVIGSYAVNNSLFDLLIMAIFGIVGYFMHKCNFPQPPLLLAMILAPIAETNFRRALTISQNDYTVFFTRPFSGIVLTISILLLLRPAFDMIREHLKQKKTPAQRPSQP